MTYTAQSPICKSILCQQCCLTAPRSHFERAPRRAWRFETSGALTPSGQQTCIMCHQVACRLKACFPFESHYNALGLGTYGSVSVSACWEQNARLLMFLCAILEGLRFIVVNRSIFGISSIDTGLSTTRLTQPLESLARENNAFNAFTSGVLEPPYEDDHRKSVETGFHAQQKGEKEDSLNLQRSKIQTDLSFSFCSENCHCRDSIAIVLVSRRCAMKFPALHRTKTSLPPIHPRIYLCLCGHARILTELVRPNTRSKGTLKPRGIYSIFVKKRGRSGIRSLATSR